MKFDELADKIINEADVERLAQQDPREVYGDGPEEKSLAQQGQDADNQLREEGYKLLKDAFHKFYEYGYTGSADTDPGATNERVVDMLRDMEVDDRDMQRFGDALTSIILGQMVRGHADF